MSFYFLLVGKKEAVTRRYSVKKLFLEISKNSQENTWGLQFYQKRDCYRCFPVNFVKFLRIHFFIEHLRWLLLILLGKKVSGSATVIKGVFKTLSKVWDGAFCENSEWLKETVDYLRQGSGYDSGNSTDNEFNPKGIIHLVRTQNFRKTSISYPLIPTRSCTYQGFSENFAYVPNEWSQTLLERY